MVFDDALFEAQWLHAVGHSSSGGAERVECLTAARLIRERGREGRRRSRAVVAVIE